MLIDNARKQPGLREMFRANESEANMAAGTARMVAAAAICLLIVTVSVSGVPRMALDLFNAAHANSPAAQAEAAGKTASADNGQAGAPDMVVEMSN